MVKLYIMCGLAFSGKSTLARKIAEHTGSTRIAFDELWIEKSKQKPIPEGVEGWKYIRNVAQAEVLASLKAGKSVVYDDNNPKREHREELRDVGRQAGADVIIVYLETPIEVIRAREEANRTSQDRHEVEAKNFQKVVDDFETPSKDENVLIYKPESNLEDFQG